MGSPLGKYRKTLITRAYTVFTMVALCNRVDNTVFNTPPGTLRPVTIGFGCRELSREGSARFHYT